MEKEVKIQMSGSQYTALKGMAFKLGEEIPSEGTHSTLGYLGAFIGRQLPNGYFAERPEDLPTTVRTITLPLDAAITVYIVTVFGIAFLSQHMEHAKDQCDFASHAAQDIILLDKLQKDASAAFLAATGMSDVQFLLEATPRAGKLEASELMQLVQEMEPEIQAVIQRAQRLVTSPADLPDDEFAGMTDEDFLKLGGFTM